MGIEKFDLTGVELGGKLDLAGVKGTPAHSELDDPKILEKIAEADKKVDEEMDRLDYLQGKVMEHLNDYVG